MEGKNITLDNSIITYGKHLLMTCHNAIDNVILTESLPIRSANNLKSADLCVFQVNRIFNMVGYISREDNGDESLTCESFEPLQIFSGLADAFLSTVSGYIPVEVDCYSKLEHHYPLNLNKSKFELLFLNLLYCCMKTADDSHHKNPKFTMYITENKSSVIFHLRDNCPVIDKTTVDKALSKNEAISHFEHFNESVLDLSLQVAAKAARELSGTLSYKPLKGGNRFDFTVPKFLETGPSGTQALRKYNPNNSLCLETFSGLIMLWKKSKEDIFL